MIQSLFAISHITRSLANSVIGFLVGWWLVVGSLAGRPVGLLAVWLAGRQAAGE